MGAELEVSHRPGTRTVPYRTLQQGRAATTIVIVIVAATATITVVKTLCLFCSALQVKSLGFNCFRIPYSNQMLHNGSHVEGVWWELNPEMIGLTPLQCLDKIVAYCGEVGIRIILDRHSSKADEFTKESFWFDLPLYLSISLSIYLSPYPSRSYPVRCRYLPGDPYYTEQLFIDDWVMLARRYRNTAVVAADLWNEPKMNSTWGTGDLASDWRLAAERVGNAIQAVNPDWLLVVEGVGGATWWGGNFLINYSPTLLHCTALHFTIHFETVRPPSSSNQGT